MPFQFIDNSAIDRRSRKLIRSHVMKGINKGRTISRPSKKQPIRQRVTPVTPDTELFDYTCISGPSSVVEQISGPSMLSSIATPVGRRFSSVRLPIELGPYARSRLTQFLQLVDESLYPPEFCYQPDYATSVYVEFMSIDAAFLHCTIALSTSFIDLFLGNQEVISRSAIPPEALMHIAHAFRLTNGKLSSHEALNNHTLAAVVCLSLHEQLLRDYTTGRIHLAGLAKIVGLRGGLLQLPRELAQKICRCDIDVALHDGTPPLLRYPGLSGDQVYATFGSTRKHSRLADLHPDSALGCIAADISTVADFLNSETRHRKLDPLTYQDLVVDLGYRLLEYRPPCGDESLDTLHEALHLALTAFMTTFIMHFGHQRQIRFDSLSIRLKDALHKPWTSEPANRPFLLWALVVGGISEFDLGDYDWLLPEIRRAADGLGIYDWESVRVVMLQYPWVKVLHDDQAKRLWGSASSF
ncbi:hypothetical protein CONLIGDRAFT_670859 [Coniochaeta ligniaria NRRL 30616]|uniref:Fungal-specific transcription factor domain-containing protein n=1 Tax=Coniochaeta ligniaria NRRL 30616 TaxID=1408157 RepID=A0A1J7IP82_9PEZI|nr:hypothetical protein CONLIGDRAFT_670859 [Coniochaeta ligniaria NRRL 30616]